MTLLSEMHSTKTTSPRRSCCQKISRRRLNPRGSWARPSLDETALYDYRLCRGEGQRVGLVRRWDTKNAQQRLNMKHCE